MAQLQADAAELVPLLQERAALLRQALEQESERSGELQVGGVSLLHRHRLARLPCTAEAGLPRYLACDVRGVPPAVCGLCLC